MDIEEALAKTAQDDPERLRNWVFSERGGKLLAAIGIRIKRDELHAPSPMARQEEGLGKTLCGRNGMRHSEVTCQQCLSKLAGS